MDLLRRLRGFDRVDQIGVAATWPWPAADFAERFFVNSNQDDIAAGRTLVNVITDNAQPIFGVFARAKTVRM